MDSFRGAFKDRTVLVTGHTGFKGSWLCEWLLELGARVVGYALPPAGEPSLFLQLGLADRIEHHEGDIRELAPLAGIVRESQPDFVFHLAAQPLVRLSYAEPVETHATNYLGTVHVLESLRALAKPCAAVMVTTDKCYENREWCYGYREEDALGGHDPYSASKAAAELAIASYRRAFFAGHPVRIASARAGNVIGGGDWAKDRIVPDCIRALDAGESIRVRNKTSTRPWQHVLEPLGGYLCLAAVLANPAFAHCPPEQLGAAFNFGPAHEANRTVAELVIELLKHRSGHWEDCSDPKAVHEAGLLHLVTDKARAQLGWAPVWDFAETIAETVSWYDSASNDGRTGAVQGLTVIQIRKYVEKAGALGLSWTLPAVAA